MSERFSTALPAAIRREQILAILERRGFVTVNQLSSYFQVSKVTVRTDLDQLAEQASLERVHGGAIAAARAPELERSYEIAEREHAGEKLRIGQAAAQLVQSHQVVMIDAGTTTTATARALAARDQLVDVTIVTSSLNIALELESTIPRFDVIVTGGTVRPAQHSLVDPLADLVISRVHADLAFIGCNGLTTSAGATNLSFPDGEMKRLMVAQSDRAVLVADSSKIGRITNWPIMPLTDLDVLITGSESEGLMLEQLREAGLDVLTV